MAAPVTIDQENKLSWAEDYDFLRKEGIKLIQDLSGKIWTDYNTHDPGITLLEAFCYAITDLGYRTQFDIKDLLTPPESSQDTPNNHFLTARQVLPSNPITLLDYRKLIIDIEGVRNAWIEISDDTEIPIYLQEVDNQSDPAQPAYGLSGDGGELLRLKGLYKVFVEYESTIIFQKKEEEVAQKIKERLYAHRNLGEDFVSVTSIEYEYFKMGAEIQVSEGQDIEKINARIYEVIYNFFSPPVTFYSLEQMLAKGYSAEEIFEGPVLRHGFIESSELEKSKKYKDVHLSDIMRLISGIEGVIAIKKFTLPLESQSAFSDFTSWLTNVKDSQRAPRLDTDNSQITFVRSGDRHRNAAEKQPNKERVKALFSFFQSANLRSRLKGAGKDLPVPTGECMNLLDYYPVQKSLPAVYGLSESYLDPPLDQLTLQRAAYELLDAQVGLPLREVLNHLRLEKPYDDTLREQIDELLKPGLPPEEVDFMLHQIATDKENASMIAELLPALLPVGTTATAITDQIAVLLTNHRKYPVSVSPATQEIQAMVTQTVNQPLLQVTQDQDIRQVRAAYRLYQLKKLEPRQRLTLQLRGFLMVFEQILADYLGQLAAIRDTFSFTGIAEHTYFPQTLADVPDRAALFMDYEKFAEEQSNLAETEEAYQVRRNRLLDHLMGRMAEDFTKYNYFMQASGGKAANKQLITDKTAFLKDYVVISAYRSQGFNYSNPEAVWNSANVSGLKKRICRLLGIPDYTQKFIAQDALFIQETTLDNQVKRYVVVLTDPDNRDTILLRSVEFEFSSEAEEILNYMLMHGANPDLYEKEGRRDKWQYHLKKFTQENDYEIVASQSFAKQVDSEASFDRTLTVLTNFSRAENFHVIEHILLRPKVAARERSGKRGNALNADTVEFLSVNATPAIQALTGFKPTDPVYKFRIINTKNEGKTNWRLSLTKEDYDEVLGINEDFLFYKHLTRRLEQIRQFASDRANFVIDQNADGYNIFRLVDVDRVLAESKKRYRKPEDLDAELNSLVAFFSFELQKRSNQPEEENALVAQADPYSFQISIVIPEWPARFRNKTFMHLLEKTIYMETPAHIYPQVYWLNHKQMRELEEAYKIWLEELPQADIANTEVVNNLVYQLNELRK
ncbi:hypothetical protein [Adhaeribacter pallidiroseus]|uniref:Uncharacterized protein n=1 Tax=Adhaeribacter pallidiroseus TaxID=2072847 RepID=A0A369QGK8_9BACT|nr:hypothetical protein [Adhaeribacter pallidiroseus]RDC62685.1 hypothetical protein AHMF7616_01279 [Adhaeribacter pallidiroseus]